MAQQRAVISSRLNRRFARYRRRLHHLLHLPIRHAYANFTILLPPEHLLPVYQRQHPNYDRFLPHLVAALGPAATIIDVGANCGDTLAGMVERNPQATYLCIEPDPVFFRYLQDNIARIASGVGPLSVLTVQSLVGQAVGEVALAGSGGSRHAASADGAQVAHSSVTLDAILAALPPLAVDLLKSDVDGFDFDVLNSAQGLLTAQHPMLFFEAQCDSAEQLSGFIQTIAWLETLGYCHWTAFDNFGTILLRSIDAHLIPQLLHYVWQQNCGQTTRTIHYLDLLACTEPNIALIEGVLDSY